MKVLLLMLLQAVQITKDEAVAAAGGADRSGEGTADAAAGGRSFGR